jgi:hypothetical protein
MISFVTIARKQVIQRRPARNSMENHQGWGVMEETNGTIQEDCTLNKFRKGSTSPTP